MRKRSVGARWRMVGVAVVMVLSTLVVTAGPSEASHINCTWHATDTYQGLRVRRPARSSSDSTRVCVMRRGHRSISVRILQDALNECYPTLRLPRLAEDGIFGPLTEAVLREVQRAEGARFVDGIYGPESADLVRFRTLEGRGCRSRR